MKKSILARSVSIILATSLMLGMTACGDSSNAESSSEVSSSAAGSEQVKGESKTWGSFTVLVPDGWTLKGGDVFDEKDENICSVRKSDFTYLDFKSEKEEVMKQQYDYNHRTYTLNQKDLPETEIAGIKWNGFEYGAEINPGFELYASYSGKNLRVSCVGFTFNSKEAQAILDSLKIND
ncbi:hypothetical protein [Ruminococcus sp. FC2018]|uniref:hypothetical protein n=1 Tax=Ruminococcus sp. FC2018 TaxID=1410617 RepID=UPI000490FDA6|nr:hypothetical protein [Ruminococcus sp. FC2018]